MQHVRIMIAHEPGRSQVIIGALTGYDLVVVSTLDAAVSLIKEDGIKLFVIGVHFDESRAIELVNEIRKDRKHKSTPIVLLRQSSIRITSLLRTTIDSLKKSALCLSTWKWKTIQNQVKQ